MSSFSHLFDVTSLLFEKTHCKHKNRTVNRSTYCQHAEPGVSVGFCIGDHPLGFAAGHFVLFLAKENL